MVVLLIMKGFIQLRTYLTTGFLQGCRVSEQQSNPLIESLLNLSERDPYPEALASLFFS